MRKEILSKLGYLERYVSFLKEMKNCSRKEFLRDTKTRSAVERAMQISLEIAIEIAEMIIAKEGYKKPESNKEAILLLGEHGIMSKKFAKKFAPAAGLRNILVHGYAEVDSEKIYKHLQNDIGDFDAFARCVVKYLKKRNS